MTLVVAIALLGTWHNKLKCQPTKLLVGSKTQSERLEPMGNFGSS